MPTIKIIGPYRLFFYANDKTEPIHVHVERDDKAAKYWLNPVRLQKNSGFNRNEISQIHKIVEENSREIEEVWDEYFGH